MQLLLRRVDEIMVIVVVIMIMTTAIFMKLVTYRDRLLLLRK